MNTPLHPYPYPTRGLPPRPRRRSWVFLLLLLAGNVLLNAQNNNLVVQTNDNAVADDLTGAEAQSAETTADEEVAGGTNTLSGTNVIAAPGPDGRTRRRSRQSQSRSRDSGLNQGSRSANDTNGSPNSLDYSAFRLVADRNIFDPNRAPRSVRTTAQPRTVESFTLVGTMSYEKGIFAFFDGTSSDYKKALKPEDTIAGYKVVAIAPDSVKLMHNTNVLELAVGTQMRRREDGSWDRSSGSQSYAPAASSGAAATDSPPSGAENDVLKKMMMRREKE